MSKLREKLREKLRQKLREKLREKLTMGIGAIELAAAASARSVWYALVGGGASL